MLLPFGAGPYPVYDGVAPLPDAAAGHPLLTRVDPALGVEGQSVSFRWTCVFAADGQVLTSDSTLRFREREEVGAELVAAGFVVEDVRDAPDRPGRELVFVARRL